MRISDWSSDVCSSDLYAAATIEHRPGGSDTNGGFSHKLQFGFADINRDNFDPSIGDDPNFSARGRSERLSYSIDWSALGGDRLRLLAGAEREWAHALTSSAFSRDREMGRAAGRERGWTYV